MTGRRAPSDRPRRVLARLGVLALVAALTLTGAAAVVDLATRGRAAPPAGLRYVAADGVRTRYLTWGSAGSPVLLVHGAAETAATWAPLARRLATDHRVYAYDVVGWGYTQHTGRYTTDDEVAQLLGVIRALGLDHPVLVGHSSGAAAVVGAALADPDLVAGVMLLDGDALATGAGARTGGPDLGAAPWSLYSTAALRLGVRSDALVRAVYARACGPDCARLDDAGVRQWVLPFQVAGGEQALWTRLRLGVSGYPATTVARLRAVDLPKAVVFGTHDPVFPAGTAQSVATMIGAPAPTLIATGRHLTMIGEPDQMAAAVRALCARAAA